MVFVPVLASLRKMFWLPAQNKGVLVSRCVSAPLFVCVGSTSMAPIVGMMVRVVPYISAGTLLVTLSPALVTLGLAGVKLFAAAFTYCGSAIGEPFSCVGYTAWKAACVVYGVERYP
ncbi:hypothetical protein D9M68_741330 [compost metagenome]